MALVRIGESNIHEAEKLKGRLKSLGISVELAVAPGNCSGGACGIKAEIWAHEEDLPAIQGHFVAERERQCAGLDFDPEQVAQVFDPSAAEATCPACAERFSTTHQECPGCGLAFSIPET